MAKGRGRKGGKRHGGKRRKIRKGGRNAVGQLISKINRAAGEYVRKVRR